MQLSMIHIAIAIKLLSAGWFLFLMLLTNYLRYAKSGKLYIDLQKRKELEKITTTAIGCAEEKLL